MPVSRFPSVWPLKTPSQKAPYPHISTKYATIPAVLLQGALKNQEPPLPASTLQPGRLQSVSEFWQALGGKPKAALNYTVTIAVFPQRDEETERPVMDKTIMIRAGVE